MVHQGLLAHQGLLWQDRTTGGYVKFRNRTGQMSERMRIIYITLCDRTKKTEQEGENSLYYSLWQDRNKLTEG